MSNSQFPVAHLAVTGHDKASLIKARQASCHDEIVVFLVCLAEGEPNVSWRSGYHEGFVLFVFDTVERKTFLVVALAVNCTGCLFDHFLTISDSNFPLIFVNR